MLRLHRAPCSLPGAAAALPAPPCPALLPADGPASPRLGGQDLGAALSPVLLASRSDTASSADPDLTVLLPSSAHPPSGLRTAVSTGAAPGVWAAPCRRLGTVHAPIAGSP